MAFASLTTYSEGMPKKLDPKVAEAVMLKAGLKPLEPFARSHEKWKCIHIACGDIVYPSYHQIIQGRGGCKPCGYAKNGLNSRKSEAEAVSIMLKAGLKPLEPFKTLTSKWKCTHIACGKTVFPTCASISRGRGGCVECGRKVTSEKTRTTETDAVAIMLKAGLEPLEPYKGATVKWKCKHINCGNIVYPKYNWIQQGQSGCRPCASAKNGFEKRLSRNEVESFLNTLELQIIGEYQGSENAFQISCLKCGDTSSTLWGNLQKRKGAGCEKCARSVLDISDKEAELFMRKHGLEMLTKYEGVDIPTECRCLVCKQITHISRVSVFRRKYIGLGCATCANQAGGTRKVESGKQKALESLRKKNLILLGDYVSASSPTKVRCAKCNYVFNTRFAQLVRQKYGCGKCAGNIVDPKEALEIMHLNGYKPIDPYIDNKTKWRSIHLKCGSIVYPLYSTIRSGSGACRHCATHGFKYSKSAFLYLIYHGNLNALKVGIANPAKIAKSDRLNRYKHHGWQVFRIWNFDEGREAEDVENAVLYHLRVTLGLPSYLSASEMSGQGGHTETVDSDSITILELEKIINKVIKGLQE